MNSKVKLIIAAVLIFFSLKMCNGCGGSDSISSIAGTYTFKLFEGGSLEQEVLNDGRVRFEQNMTTKTGRVKEVVDGVFVVTFNDKIYLSIRTSTGGHQMGWGPLILDTNDNKMYWGYDDYENRDISKVEYASFR